MEFCSGSYQGGREVYVLVANTEYRVGRWMKKQFIYSETLTAKVI
jgi:hypothetical protein